MHTFAQDIFRLRFHSADRLLAAQTNDDSYEDFPFGNEIERIFSSTLRSEATIANRKIYFTLHHHETSWVVFLDFVYLWAKFALTNTWQKIALANQTK